MGHVVKIFLGGPAAGDGTVVVVALELGGGGGVSWQLWDRDRLQVTIPLLVKVPVQQLRKRPHKACIERLIFFSIILGSYCRNYGVSYF